MKRIALIIPAIALVGAIGFYSIQTFAKAEDKAEKTQEVVAQEVATIELQTQSIDMKRALPGRITAFRQSVVRPQVDGIIVTRLFEEGAEVEKGQQLYQIDDTRYAAVLNSAKADLESAKTDVASVQARADRYEELVKANAVSKQEYDDAVAAYNRAKAEVSVAQAAVDLAQVDVDFSKVYAPISGRISRSHVTEGALVTANQTQELATITQLDPVYVDMQQSGSENEIFELTSALQSGQKIEVSVTLKNKDDKAVHEEIGELKLSEVTMEETTASTTLRALVPNVQGRFLPGMYVHATINMGNQNALLVPQRATTRNAKGDVTAWIVNTEGKAETRTLNIVDSHQDQWIVEGGVEAGETLIVEGYQKVTSGQDVRAVAWKSASK